MQNKTGFWRWFGKRLACLVLATLVCGGLLCVILAHSTAASSYNSAPAWANPSAMAIRRVALVTGHQNEQTLFSNLDCSLMNFRSTTSAIIQTNCFVQTIFGLFDSDTGNVIFNGTDESLPLIPYIPHQVLAPWPGALDLISLDPVNTGGVYFSLYRNPLMVLQDQRDLLGQLTAKKLTGLPDLTLKDLAGQRLIVNPQTLAFSASGSWLVVETLTGSFVRVNLATLDMTAFAPAFGTQGSPGLLKSRVAVSDNGRFVAIMNVDAASFKVYDLTTCGAPVTNLQPQNCQSYDYYPFAQRQISGLQSIRHLRFINDGLLSFEAITTASTTTGTYELAPTASITSLTDYIGLGDSYTSGEGAFDYLIDTDSDSNACHLSRRSYPLLLTDHLFSASGGHSVACSGAVINDIGATSDGYHGQMRGFASLRDLQQNQPLLLESVETNFLPGYVAQHRFVRRWQPRIITVSVGGDDVGFGALVRACVAPHLSRHFSGNTCFNTYEDRLELLNLIDRTIPRWTALYRQLLQESPETRLYAIGYPQLFDDTGHCPVNVQLNSSELEFAGMLIDYLNRDIRKAAEAAGVTYVDISQALSGHRLCETANYNVAVNGVTAGKDGGPFGTKIFGTESYHPNALGQSLIEQAILTKTHNLADPPSTTPAIPDTSKLLQVPKTGRPVAVRLPRPDLSARLAKKNATTTVRASGVTNGLKPNTAYTVRLDGLGGFLLGTANSDAQGDISANVFIPDTVTAGGHTIDLTGENEAGELANITQPIFILVSDADSDGDTIPDILDTCPGAVDSGQDEDKDGTDDICDRLIGLPPNPSAFVPSSNVSVGGSNTTPVVTSPNLQPLPQTIVTTFTAANFAMTMPAITNSKPSVAKVLGVATANPQLVGKTVIRQSRPALPATPAPRSPSPRFILWRAWLWLLGICWLLLLLAWFCARQALRQRGPHKQFIKTRGLGLQ